MRALPLLLAAGLLAAFLPAEAQPLAFTQGFQVRAAVGDIPTTPAAEPSGAWNVEQRYTADLGTEPADVRFLLPPGASLVNATCTCGVAGNASGRAVTFPSSGQSGEHTYTVLSTQPLASVLALEVERPGGPGDGAVVLYVPVGSEVSAPLATESPGLSTDGRARIVYVSSDDLPRPFWASVHPAGAGGAGTPDEGRPALSWPVALGLGAVLGAVAWAVLVQKGAVQRKGRRQVAATAAHVEAAAAEPPAVLEGRKRALLAALKEVEVARMNNEMAPDVYDALKADLKKQAVTVMRALETAGAGEAKA